MAEFINPPSRQDEHAKTMHGKINTHLGKYGLMGKGVSDAMVLQNGIATPDIDGNGQ